MKDLSKGLNFYFNFEIKDITKKFKIYLLNKLDLNNI